MAEPLEPIFHALREAMLRCCSGMTVATDEPGSLIVKTSWNEPGKTEPAWFGAVQLKKNFVSYHLMPLYALPELAERVPRGLEARKQGKSCFNFKKDEPELFGQLEQFTAECAAAYSAPVAARPH